MSLDALWIAARSGDLAARRALADALHAWLGSFFRRYPASIFEVEDRIRITIAAIVEELDGFTPRHPRAFEARAHDIATRILHSRSARLRAAPT
ncbi:hypothetical protein ACNOYE_02970 [Nannocystaceae bacterium ST9]